MSLDFAFALLLTLQSLQLVSTQISNQWDENLTPPPFNGIPDEWNRGNGINSPEEDIGTSSGSMTFSGDDEYLAGNQTVIAVTGQNDDNVNTTPLPQTTFNVSSNPKKFFATSIKQVNTSNPVTPNPNLGPSTTNGSHVNLTETYTMTPSPRNSANITTTTNTTTSAPAFNITQNSTVSYTKSPTDNSTNTTVFTTTTMLNHTSVVQLNESSTTTNRTGGSLDVRGNMDRGKGETQMINMVDSEL